MSYFPNFKQIFDFENTSFILYNSPTFKGAIQTRGPEAPNSLTF